MSLSAKGGTGSDRVRMGPDGGHSSPCPATAGEPFSTRSIRQKKTRLQGSGLPPAVRRRQTQGPRQRGLRQRRVGLSGGYPQTEREISGLEEGLVPGSQLFGRGWGGGGITHSLS